MAKPWQTLDAVETEDGRLELRRRDHDDFLITVNGRVLMNSRARRSEEALADVACQALQGRAAPELLLGGLGMGCTLRAALEGLPADATVEVCELNPTVVAWCRGPLAELCGEALTDARVRVTVADVAERIRTLAVEAPGSRDAVLLDLFEGPHAGTDPHADPFYGASALALVRSVLKASGVFAIWSEDPERNFEKRLGDAGFQGVDVHRPGRGGRRHAVYLARAGAP